jgi:hypothetical protein
MPPVLLVGLEFCAFAMQHELPLRVTSAGSVRRRPCPLDHRSRQLRCGQAFFVGPTAFLPLKDPWSVTVSWTIRAAGHAVGVPGSLDLTNFEREAFRVEFDLEPGVDNLK